MPVPRLSNRIRRQNDARPRKNALRSATAAKAAAIAASGPTPLDYMLSVLRDESADRHERMEAARNAAPYVHAKFASLEHSGGLETFPVAPIEIRLVRPKDSDLPT
jgi:hypothetical protein